jgi:hypothetical protein
MMFWIGFALGALIVLAGALLGSYMQGVHKHNPVVIRVKPFKWISNVEALKYTAPKNLSLGEDWTRIHWRCKDCGKMWTTEQRGTWKIEDFG